jgi:hypothetical protein
VAFTGRVDKANAVKSFLDPQIRAAVETQFEATYSLAFKQPLSPKDESRRRILQTPDAVWRWRSLRGGGRREGINDAPIRTAHDRRIDECVAPGDLAGSLARHPAAESAGARCDASGFGPAHRREPLLKRLAREKIVLGSLKPGKTKRWPLDEEVALTLGLLFRALAPMKNLDRIRQVAEGVEKMSREEAGYWLGMVMHREYPRRVLAVVEDLADSP